MRYWILKAKTEGADAYNYARKLKPGHSDNWERISASGEIAVGDRVFLWASASNPHLAGLGEVIEPKGEFLRVRYLTSQLAQGPDITFLKSRKEFAEANFLKPIPRTAFEVSVDQAKELYRIVTTQNPGINLWTDWPKSLEVSSTNISQQLARRLPDLRDYYGDEIRSLEQARRAFIKDYSIQKLAHLPLDKYASGLGEGTFCYRVEWELDGLGRIRGSYATKFGVYFSKSDNRYVFTRIWGSSVSEAYTRLRAAILQLLHDAEDDDIDALIENRISPMFKGKILHLYFPEKFAPIYAPEHLKHFIACLNIPGNHATSIERQQALMAYRQAEPLLRNEPVGLMMRFLYSEFPPKGKEEEPEQEDGDRSPETTLSEAMAGLELLDALPPSGGADAQPKAPKPGKYDADNGRRKHIGDRGESIVFESEKKRLLDANCPNLANKVQHVAATDDTQGYDILSFEEDGTPRQIEVKATTGKNLGRGFYLTANELRAAQSENANYYIYFVFDALSDQPRIYPQANPQFGPKGFILRPTQYHVTIAP